MRTRSSFTIIELIIVLVLIGILAFSLNFNFFNNNLQLAADTLISNIRLTQSLALKDDKYQPFPNDSTVLEQNRSKYWFKQWWHLKITSVQNIYTGGYDIVYYIFSDQPRAYRTTNFDNKTVTSAQYIQELAKNPLTNKYLIGADKNDTGNNNYPRLDEIDTKLNLTKTYGIVQVEYNSHIVSRYHPLDLLFDNFGNVFQKEGDKGDAGDINPLDINRKLLTKKVYIRLCLDSPCNLDKKRCIQINITPNGYVYETKCEN